MLFDEELEASSPGKGLVSIGSMDRNNELFVFSS